MISIKHLIAIAITAVIPIAHVGFGTGLGVWSGSVGATPISPPASAALLVALHKQHPDTTFSNIAPTPIAGIYEVALGNTGNQVAYTDAAGRYFIFGTMFDTQTQTQTNLTQARQSSSADGGQAFTVSDLAQAHTISLPPTPRIQPVAIDTDASIQAAPTPLYIFSDPLCSYCKRLEVLLEQIPNVQPMIIMLAQLPGSADAARAVLCPANGLTQAAAWLALVRNGKRLVPAPAQCDASGLKLNAVLAKRLNVQGTPTLFAANGARKIGASSSAEIIAWLEQQAANLGQPKKKIAEITK